MPKYDNLYVRKWKKENKDNAVKFFYFLFDKFLTIERHMIIIYVYRMAHDIFRVRAGYKEGSAETRIKRVACQLGKGDKDNYEQMGLYV